MTAADDQWADVLRLQLSRAETVQRAADALAHAQGLAAHFPTSYVEKARTAHRRAVEAYERGERGLA